MERTNHQNIFRVAVRKFAPFESTMDKLWAGYCAASGCELKAEFIAMDLHELHETTLLHKGLANGAWDIAHLNTDWLLEGYEGAAIEDLKPYLDENPPEGFPDGWSRSLLSLQQFDKQVLGLPFHDGPECLIYRKDLFEDPEEQEAYFKLYGEKLAPPTSWAGFRQLSHFFHRPEQHLYGSVFAGYPDGHNTVFDFCLQLWSRGGQLTNDQGKININSPEAVASVEFYRQLLNDDKAVHPGSADFDSVKAGAAFSRGEAALMINWFGFASVCEVDAASNVKGKVGITVLPVAEGHVPASLNVYWLYTIGSGSRNKAIAYDFIRYSVNKESDKLLTLEGGIGCRISTWKDEEINQIIPYYHQLEQLHVGAKSLPQKRNWAAIASIVDEMVLKARHSAVSTESLLKDAQAQIDSIDN